MNPVFELDKYERDILESLSTPEKIQDFLDTLPNNLSKHGGSCASPRMALRNGRAHCIEGAFIAAAALWLHGDRPLLLDLKALSPDYDHVVALYRRNGYWGALSKTNHPVLRYRDPIYRTIRELALSYFHEYVLVKTGEKTLRTYSRPFSLKRFGTDWITSPHHLWDIAQMLDESVHYPIIPSGQEHFLRKASLLERQAGSLTEWKRSDPRT
mgnify:CR=1 FL=1